MTMFTISRRTLLCSGVAAGALSLAGCATTSTGGIGLSTAVIDAIQAAVSNAAKYLPVAESIAQTAASLFGPAYVAIVQVGSAALNQVVAALVAAVTTLPPAARHRLSIRLRGSSPSSPVVIGKTPEGVTVVGYRT